MSNARFRSAGASFACLCAATACTLLTKTQVVCAQPSETLQAPAHEEQGPLSPEQASAYRAMKLDGYQIMVHEALLIGEPLMWERVRVHLRADLDEITHRLPAHAIELLRATTPIWVELQGRVVPGGMSGRGKYFHPSREWLSGHGILPDKVDGIEIANAADYLEWRRNQPYGLLHEFAHAWWFKLSLEQRAPVQAAYEQAMQQGLYEQVGYNLAPEGEPRRAYAASNVNEYFAELSEAWFALNDYQPMTRPQLVAFDPIGAHAVEQVWNLVLELAEQIDTAHQNRLNGTQPMDDIEAGR